VPEVDSQIRYKYQSAQAGRLARAVALIASSSCVRRVSVVEQLLACSEKEEANNVRKERSFHANMEVYKTCIDRTFAWHGAKLSKTSAYFKCYLYQQTPQSIINSKYHITINGILLFPRYQRLAALDTT
jgi:hypothetical protein